MRKWSVRARIEGSSSKCVVSSEYSRHRVRSPLVNLTAWHKNVCVGYRTAAPNSVDCHRRVTAGLDTRQQTNIEIITFRLPVVHLQGQNTRFRKGQHRPGTKQPESHERLKHFSPDNVRFFYSEKIVHPESRTTNQRHLTFCRTKRQQPFPVAQPGRK